MKSRHVLRNPALVLLYLIFSINIAHAGDSGMSEEQMQQMMQAAEKIQECYAKIDQGAMQSLNAKTEKMQAEISALCAAGKRDEAQNRAMEHGKEIANSKVMQEMKKCGEMAGEMMKQMPMPQVTEGDFTGAGHVCDSM